MDVKRMLPMTLKGTEGSRGRRQIREDQTFSKRKSKFMLDQSAILLNKKKKKTLKNDGASLFTALRGGSTSHEFTSGEKKRESGLRRLPNLGSGVKARLTPPSTTFCIQPQGVKHLPLTDLKIFPLFSLPRNKCSTLSSEGERGRSPDISAP